MIRHYYSEEEDNFLIDNVKGISLKELREQFNKKFGYNLSESAIANRKNKLGLSSGIKGGQFQKGSVPFNKGKKQKDYMSEEAINKTKNTRFKKGNIPHNHRPLGSERTTIEGYIEVKVAEPNKWKTKAVVIYEEKYGKIPKGHKVIYLDGNRQNLDISNLKVISSAEELIMNSNNLRYDNKELTESGCLVAKIINKRRKLKNDRL